MRSCVRFNNSTAVDAELHGWFADPTPQDNSEYGNYTTQAISMGNGWRNQLNIGRAFNEPKGDAIARVDLLQVAIHEIGHAWTWSSRRARDGDNSLAVLTRSCSPN